MNKGNRAQVNKVAFNVISILITFLLSKLTDTVYKALLGKELPDKNEKVVKTSQWTSLLVATVVAKIFSAVLKVFVGQAMVRVKEQMNA